MPSLIVKLATLYTDISPRLKWGKKNDAHEFFLALVQSLLPTTDTRYNIIPYDVMRYCNTLTRSRQDAMKDLFVEVTQKG